MMPILLRFYYVYLNTNNDMRNKQLHVTTEQGGKGQIRNVKKYGKYLNQCKYSATLRHVQETVVAVEKQ